LTDAVEKVGVILLTRNNRIIGVDFLNRSFAIDTHFESMLLGEPSKIFFRQHRPVADVNLAAEPAEIPRCSYCDSPNGCYGMAAMAGYGPSRPTTL
jgi:hypothetical protein